MDFTAFNAFDYIVIAIIGLSTLFAFSRGFIQTVMSFIAWFGSLFIAAYLFPHVQPVVAGHIENPIIANTVAFLGAYFVLIIGFVILGYQLVYIVGALRFGPVDRALGFAFGVLRGVVLVTVMFMIITLFLSLFGEREKTADGREGGAPKNPTWLAEAQTYDLLRKSSAAALHMVPDKVWDKVRGFAQSFDAPKHYASWNPTPQVGHTVKDMAGALPEERRKEIFKKYGLPVSAPETAVPLTNFEFSRDVFHAYRDAMEEGKAHGLELSPEALQTFEKIFNLVQPSVNNVLKNKESIQKSAYNNGQGKQLESQVKELDKLLRE